ncbi:hypothetical protein LTR17_010637 [Elasticomyces elasticus]|nr:hypothetical protein LTR17_010637 [Elasticomyces elasticus]
MTAQVLALPELLETILLGLPIKDLLFAQKVCKTWKQIMGESTSIQRALFFKPGAACDVDLADKNRAKNVALVSVLADQGIALNPLLFQRGSTYTTKMTKFKNYFVLDGLAQKAESPASCLKMLMSQPPACMTAILVVEQSIDESKYTEEEIELLEAACDDTWMVSRGLEVGRSGVATFGDMLERAREQKASVQRVVQYRKPVVYLQKVETIEYD